MPDDFFGIHLRNFVIGIQAGLSMSLIPSFRKLTAIDMMARMIVGGFSANYFAEPIQELVSKLLVHVSIETSAFVAGVAGFSIFRGIVLFVRFFMIPLKRMER